jgi:hypothetical protein
LLVAFGEATGGHGVPGVGLIPELLGDAPPLLLWVFPPAELAAVDGFELDDPEFVVLLAVPSLAVDGLLVPAVDGLLVPGKVPQGEPLGEAPGGFEVLGTVDGWVVFPVGFDPGVV